MIHLTINGKAIEIAEGSTILQAAKSAGIQIPTLCFLEKREPLGACRVCLVEVEGARTLVAACSTPCTEGQVVHVNSPKARAARKQVVELLLSEHAATARPASATKTASCASWPATWASAR
jgi:NADH dehydrogenase/NADH:ubiquinone oxidoreductase subunit G